LYHQIAVQLTDAIESGRLPKGEYLENEILLAEQWQVSRPTVRQAILELVQHGLLVRRRGVGTQIVNDEIRRPIRLSSLHDDLAATGHGPTTEVLRLDRVPAPADVAFALALPPGAEVVFVERCRSANGTRLAIMRNWLLPAVAADLTVADLERGGLYENLRAAGCRPHSAFQRIGAAVAGDVDAAILGLPPGAPLVTMRRVMQDDTGRTVEVGDHVYDATQYSFEMTVVESA
jgi:GntR family transcriptional regulator